MAEQQPVDAKLTSEIHKFLKKVGITSQIEIENALRAAVAEGRFDASRPLQAIMVLEIPGLGLRHTIEHRLVVE
jgi:hypothetical protein